MWEAGGELTNHKDRWLKDDPNRWWVVKGCLPSLDLPPRTVEVTTATCMRMCNRDSRVRAHVPLSCCTLVARQKGPTWLVGYGSSTIFTALKTRRTGPGTWMSVDLVMSVKYKTHVTRHTPINNPVRDGAEAALLSNHCPSASVTSDTTETNNIIISFIQR